MPYHAFTTIFGHGWKTYDPFNRPLAILNRPAAIPKKVNCLTYAYAESNEVWSFIITLRAIHIFVKVTFKEIRYITDAKDLQSWCDFGTLQPGNPSLLGSCKCLNSINGEIKFISGVWVMFLFQPCHPKPCKRVQIFGWLSTAHWNGSKFRVGEYTNDVELDQEEEELRDLSRQVFFDCLEDEYTEILKNVHSKCMPRMLEREARIAERKKRSLQRAQKRARLCVK